MKRFSKIFVLLVVSLFLVVSGVDAALDHISHSAAQSAFTVYSEQGQTLFAYSGDLNSLKVCVKPGASIAAPHFLHRT